MQTLADIRSIETIELNLLTYLGVFIYFIVLVSGVFIYFKTRKKNLTQKQKDYIKLKKIDFDNKDFKKIAYQFTLFGKKYLKNKLEDEIDTEFVDIINCLEKYKYQKEIEEVDKKIIIQMKSFVEKLGRNSFD